MTQKGNVHFFITFLFNLCVLFDLNLLQATFHRVLNSVYCIYSVRKRRNVGRELVNEKRGKEEKRKRRGLLVK